MVVPVHAEQTRAKAQQRLLPLRWVVSRVQRTAQIVLGIEFVLTGYGTVPLWSKAKNGPWTVRGASDVPRPTSIHERYNAAVLLEESPGMAQ